MANYYCKLKKITEVQWGVILSPIAFYNDKRLIYYREGYMANNLIKEGSAIFAKWSANKRYAFFNEFKENELCDYVFLDLALAIVYRIKWNKQEEEFWTSVHEAFDANIIFDRLFEKKIKPEKPFQNKITNSLFKKNDWVKQA